MKKLSDYVIQELARAWIITVVIAAWLFLVHTTGDPAYYITLGLLVLARRDTVPHILNLKRDIDALRDQVIKKLY